MRVFYGPLRALENKFMDYAASLCPGPGRPVLILCPSVRVAERLRGLLIKQTGVVSNVYFQTFGQLLNHLDRENPVDKKPLLPSDSLHDYLLKNLLLRSHLNRYPVSRGFISALRSSLRDMADALAEPEVLEEHLLSSADPMILAEREHLQWLIDVYRAYQKEMNNVLGYRSYAQYFEQALTYAEKSDYLQSFSQILVYGFYEFTGRQLELFNLLRMHYPVDTFWLYAKYPAFVFGRKFFETNILGAADEAEELAENWNEVAASEAAQVLFSPQTSANAPTGLHFVSAPDPEGELFFTAKEILRLHKEQGVAFEDMAITARNLEPYKNLLPFVLEQNSIALNASFAFTLSSQPLGVFISNLFSLLRGGFEREAVLAVTSSPYFKKKNSWRYLIDESLARRDYSQWMDLVRPTLRNYDPEFLTWLENVRQRLEFLEQPLTWETLRLSAVEFLTENTNTDIFSAEEQSIWDQVQNILAGFARYSAVAASAREREFLDELISAWQSLQFNRVFEQPGGVSAVDALNLRGLGFKVVFVLGMNEKNFPQVIYEDPVLKDYYRQILRDQLGFWLNQKMERFDEERLLFFCALEAASDQIYLSYLRGNAEGKPLVPSGYLVETARAVNVDLNSPALPYVSGRMSERLKHTESLCLTEKEMSLLLAAGGASADIYERGGLGGDKVNASLQAAYQIASRGALTSRDGQVQSGAEIFAVRNEAGFSPSALQDLARCPMKYFFSRGVGLKEKDEVLSRDALAPDARGTAYHEILMDYYAALYKEGLTGQLFAPALQDRLQSALAKHYDQKSYKRFGIYPVVWELILQNMQDKLSDFVVKDAEHLNGYVPSVFETVFEKVYEPSENLKIKLKGIIDRIDVDGKNKTFRVLDYKSSKHGGRDLAAEMFKKVILQPFIYLILAQNEKQTEGLLPDGAALLSINKGYERQELSQEGFESIQKRAGEFLTLLMALVKEGTFFINPGEHCQFCPYGAICRKDSFRTRLRAKRTAQSQALEGAKQ